MKRILAITVVVASICSPVAAQSPQTLADVAKAEEARRKSVKKTSKVYTNTALTPDITTPVPPSVPSSGSGNASANATPSNTTPGGTAAPADKAAVKDQAYWQGRISQARTELGRTQMFADSLQTKINSLKTDFVNRDNRVEREKIELELNTALAEVERLKKEVADKQKAIAAIQDEGRKAGAPAAWLR
jgi:hypothetical protein